MRSRESRVEKLFTFLFVLLSALKYEIFLNLRRTIVGSSDDQEENGEKAKNFGISSCRELTSRLDEKHLLSQPPTTSMAFLSDPFTINLNSAKLAQVLVLSHLTRKIWRGLWIEFFMRWLIFASYVAVMTSEFCYEFPFSFLFLLTDSNRRNFLRSEIYSDSVVKREQVPDRPIHWALPHRMSNTDKFNISNRCCQIHREMINQSTYLNFFKSMSSIGGFLCVSVV